MKRLFTVIALICCLQTLGAIRYVDIAATGANNGSNWLNAATDLQAAINMSVAGDVIYVAQGTYQPVTAAMYTLKEGVQILGGFPHGGNPGLADRNWTAYQTILRGNSVERLLGSIGPLSAQTVLDGLHLTGGSSKQGGLAYLMGSSMKFSNCRFFDNVNTAAQGGIFYMISGAPVIENCVFSNNSNTLAQGGVLFLNDCSAVITNCRFENNNSVAPGGVLTGLFSSPQISNCVFSNNRNTQSSGTIFDFVADCDPVVKNCLFLNNTTASGLLSFSNGAPLFSNCVFAGNNATGQVSILSTYSGAANSRLTFAGCVFYNNTSNNNRGGGMIYNAGNTVAVANCTFSNNSASTSAASSLFSNVTSNSVFTFVNSIVYNNTAATVASSVNSGRPVFRYSIVQGMNDPANRVSGAAPLFVNPANAIGPDNIWATADDGLELQPGSPATDQGENASVPPVLTTDINGGARIVNSVVDFGAYEYIPAQRPVITTTPGATIYTAQQSPTVVDGGVTITPNGSATLATVTITISAGFAAGDVLSFTNTAGMGNITGAYNNTTGQLTLTSAGATATIAQWEAALRTVAYGNTNAMPSQADRTISFALVMPLGNAATKTVTLQQANPCQPTSSTTNTSVCRSALPYLWNGQSFNTAGTYLVHLINAAGCDSAATLVLTVHEATASTTQRTICPSELPFQWNGRELTQAGTYTVTLANRNGCDSAATLELAVANSDRCLALKVIATPSGCNKSDGTITATASGGSAPYQYALDGTNYQANHVFTGLAPQAYNVSLKDASGQVVTVPITVTSDMCLDLVATPAGCNAADGTITATGSGGAPPYQYSTDGISFQANNVFTGLAPQPYNVTMKDVNGLTVTVGIVVNADRCLNLSVTATATTCGQDNGTITATATAGQPPYQFALNGGPYQANNIFTGLKPGNYKVQARDAQGLVVEADAAIGGSVAGRLSAGNNTSVLKNQPLQLHAVDVDNVGFNRYDWSPAYGLNRTDVPNPVAIIDRDAVYTVTATDPNGCQSTARVAIKVIQQADIYVPNAFTPNDDGRHDVLRAIPVGIREFKFLAIYNRWGRRVFYTTDPRNGWDGSIDGARQNTSGFVWVTEGVGADGSTVSRKGTVVLIR